MKRQSSYTGRNLKAGCLECSLSTKSGAGDRMRRRGSGLLLLLVVAAMLAPSVAAPETRHALVIGNNAYDVLPELHKAVNDAHAVSHTLSELGFRVTTETNLDERETMRAVVRFADQVAPGDTAFFFYAGHGVEIGGETYLLPIDTPEAGPGEMALIKSESISFSGVLRTLRQRGAGLTIAVVDACRDNPFETVLGRSIGTSRGLTMTVPPEGTFVIYSAGAGQVALDRLGADDPHPNSIFTREFVSLMREPGLDLPQLARRLRDEVRRLSERVGHQQRPAYYDEMMGSFAFVSAADLVKDEPPASAPATQLADQTRKIKETEGPSEDPEWEAPSAAASQPSLLEFPAIEDAYDAARRINKLEAWRRFLRNHGASRHFYLELARHKLRALEIRESF